MSGRFNFVSFLFGRGGAPMVGAVRYSLAALGGALAGYLSLTVMANLETWQFYTLRSLVTGRTVMSEIVEQPIDRWVVPVLLVVSVGGGAVVGMLLARWSRPRAGRRAEQGA
jgi:hypothetical protein